jgi:hypothetical protein
MLLVELSMKTVEECRFCWWNSLSRSDIVCDIDGEIIYPGRILLV